jgi:hypothetical protein
MAFPQNSAIKVTKSIEEEIASASSVSQIQEILHRAAVGQKLIEPDGFDPEGKNWYGFHAVEPGTVAAAKGFATAVTIDGKKHILEAGTEEELRAKETELYRAALAAPAATTETEEQPRNERGQFITHNPEAVALAPTVAAALEAQGISVDDLREFSANKQNEAFQQSWAEAAETFRANHPDWIGGEANQALFARLLGENPELMDAEDKSAALEAVYYYAVENKMLVANPELTARDAIQKAQTFDELKAAVGYRDPSSSGLWGR